jgi:hypothetical protein
MDGILTTNRNGIKTCQWRGDKGEKRERKNERMDTIHATREQMLIKEFLLLLHIMPCSR